MVRTIPEAGGEAPAELVGLRESPALRIVQALGREVSPHLCELPGADERGEAVAAADDELGGFAAEAA